MLLANMTLAVSLWVRHICVTVRLNDDKRYITVDGRSAYSTAPLITRVVRSNSLWSKPRSFPRAPFVAKRLPIVFICRLYRCGPIRFVM